MANPSKMSSMQNDDAEFLKSFPAEVIHRVLLTSPLEFHTLTVSGKPRETTPTFEQFARQHGIVPPEQREDGAGNGVSAQIAQNLHRAFHKNIQMEVQRGNVEPLGELVLEFHGALRALVPNRKDLHTAVVDDDVRNAKDAETMLRLLQKAAEALVQLEAPERSESTTAWIGQSNASVPPFGMEYASFVTASAMYLNHKAILCRIDLGDWKLATEYAPRIRPLGVEWERKHFQERFGAFGESDTAPATRAWVQEIVTRCEDKLEELQNSEEKRLEAIQTDGWVDAILFRRPRDDDSAKEGKAKSGAEAPFHMPEVLSMDVDSVREIRETTRLAVAASTLALHACNVAGISDAVLKTKDGLPPEIEEMRAGLVRAMSDRRGKSQERYEAGVADATVALARQWNESLSDEAADMLKSRASSVLRGEDPVMQLLDKRMRKVFRAMVLWEPPDRVQPQVPESMETGRPRFVQREYGKVLDQSSNFLTQLETTARERFSTTGFAFYAADLGRMCVKAVTVINMMCVIFGEAFLDKLVLDGARSNTQ